MRKVKKVVLGMTVMSMMMSMAMPMSMPATAIGGLTTVSADVVAQGRCGDKVDYQYDSTTQTLTITGSGATWDNYKISVNNGDVKKIVVGKGITTIGAALFSKMSYVDDVQIANTVTTIKQDAFAYVNGTITIPTSVKKVETNAFNGARKIVVSGDVVLSVDKQIITTMTIMMIGVTLMKVIFLKSVFMDQQRIWEKQSTKHL